MGVFADIIFHANPRQKHEKKTNDGAMPDASTRAHTHAHIHTHTCQPTSPHYTDTRTHNTHATPNTHPNVQHTYTNIHTVTHSHTKLTQTNTGQANRYLDFDTLIKISNNNMRAWQRVRR